MDITTIVFISAIVFPIVAVAGIMIFVRASIKKAQSNAMEAEALEQHLAKRERLIKSLKTAVDRQDQTLDVYRELHN